MADVSRVDVRPLQVTARAWVDYNAPPFPADVVTITDSIDFSPIFTASAEETVTVSDVIAFFSNTLAVNDAVSMDDAQSRETGFNRAFDESVTSNEVLSNGVNLGASPTDSVNMSDSLGASQGYVTSPTDSVTMSENATPETNPAIQFDPLYTESSITLSSSNRVATETTAGNSALGLRPKSSGKHFFQVLAGGNGAVTSVGVAKDTMNLTSYVGGPSDSWGYLTSGTIRNNSIVQATYSTFTTGDVIGVALDADVGKMWFSKNGSWNGDPVAGTGGLTIGAGPWRPAATPGNTGHVSTLQAGTAPSGYALW